MIVVKVYRHKSVRMMARTSGETKSDRTKELIWSKLVEVSMPQVLYEKSSIRFIDSIVKGGLARRYESSYEKACVELLNIVSAAILTILEKKIISLVLLRLLVIIISK
jgi:hypothetical protein